jgi:hypothetical protein
VLLKSEDGATLESALFSVAPVILNWKNKTVTPAGGVSVAVIPTGAVVTAGVVGVVEVTED